MTVETLLGLYAALGAGAALLGVAWSLGRPGTRRGRAIAAALAWYATLIGSFFILLALTFPYENDTVNTGRNRFIEETAFGTWGRALLVVHGVAALLAILAAFGARRPRPATAVAIGVSALAFVVFVVVLVVGGRAMGPPA